MTTITTKSWKGGKLVQYDIDGVEQPLTNEPPPVPVKLEMPKPWPTVLLPLKLMAKEGDKGAGDIIARTIGPIGGTAFKVWYRKLFGKDCGCNSRQEVLNLRWPL